MVDDLIAAAWLLELELYRAVDLGLNGRAWLATITAPLGLEALDAAAAQVLIPTPERAQRDGFALTVGEQMRLPSQFLEVRCPFSAADLTGEQRRE